MRGDHIEGALAPQAAGQRNGPWENDEKCRMQKYNCVCVFPGLLTFVTRCDGRNALGLGPRGHLVTPCDGWGTLGLGPRGHL